MTDQSAVLRAAEERVCIGQRQALRVKSRLAKHLHYRQRKKPGSGPYWSIAHNSWARFGFLAHNRCHVVPCSLPPLRA